ncbi:Pimeloyl-ACP methyl ester carboxylesterase [Flexibacter flexilis DSM 6793]|uniref:Pimeloyl-ACP methyl ester carboxylesterase n=1 Tax=Flexibacter flexilis DSM 6793 TaxID=927664 RepID=A0A1I1GLW4_9BACT|nr:alpha/beta hydrolase [Flexibacter flexilis]SFC12604.1 Pimeloyl-ACP methyl ester carboxylesterase [Flexibacter flexilis DSM 6793]
MRKITLLWGLLVLWSVSSRAQSAQLVDLDVNLSNYQYPYPVEFLRISAQNQSLQMAYMDVKPSKANGKSVLLLHGKNFNGAYWETTAKALSGAGYRVIIPDQIGFGKSSKPAHFQYTFQQLALNTKAILDTLGIEKITVLGHSMGGMVATRFALMFPQTTEKLVLVNPIGLEDWKLKVPYKPVTWWYENELKSSYDNIRKYQTSNYYDGKWNENYDRWAKLLAGWTLNKDYPLIAWNAALTYDMIFTQPVCYEFGQIACPTLLIIGDRDNTALGKPLVSEEVRKTMGNYRELGKTTQKQIKNSELVLLPNVGHLPHIEAFELFIKPLEQFLGKK